MPHMRNGSVRLDPEANATIMEILDFLTRPAPTLDELLTMVLRTGELNYRIMQLLDKANTDTFGHPQPRPRTRASSQREVHCRLRRASAKGRLSPSGHDLADLYELLKQTEGTGIQVYTHGELLPAHGYPKLKAFKHLAGNYGGG